MKKIIYILGFTVVSAHLVNAQNAYYDAVKISKYFDAEKKYGKDLAAETKLRADQILLKTNSEELTGKILSQNTKLIEARRNRNTALITDLSNEIAKLEKQLAEKIDANKKITAQLEFVRLAKKCRRFAFRRHPDRVQPERRAILLQTRRRFAVF